MEKRQIHFNIGYLILALIGVLWLREIWVTARQVQPIPYSEFQQQLKDGEANLTKLMHDQAQEMAKQRQQAQQPQQQTANGYQAAR